MNVILLYKQPLLPISKSYNIRGGMFEKSFMEKEHLGHHHHHLSPDLLAEILSRVDGPTLAAAACSSSDLRRVAEEERLWEDLCHATWPSTQERTIHNIISSSHGGFAKFYADSCPLPVYTKDPKALTGPSISHVSPSPHDFVWLVDVFYKKKCVLSKVLHGISGASGDENYDWWYVDCPSTSWFFLDCPFRLDVLNYQLGSTAVDDEDGYDFLEDDDATLPSIPFVPKKERGKSKLCRKLEKNVRLSWVLLNTKTGKAVNLSSWKPKSVQRDWPSKGNFIMHFGSVVPVEEQLLPCKSAEFAISVKCRLLEREGRLRWTEISMQVEDMEGAHVNGRTSVKVLERALRCKRSRRNWEVEVGYEEYMREKKEMMQKKMKNERFVDMLRMLSGIALIGSLSFVVFS